MLVNVEAYQPVELQQKAQTPANVPPNIPSTSNATEKAWWKDHLWHCQCKALPEKILSPPGQDETESS